MNHILPIIKKELKIYFNSPIAYIFLIVFLVVGSWLYFRGFFLGGQATMRGFFTFLPWFFLFLIPAITMRLFAEEKRGGTMEVLMTFPVKDHEVVLGKFFASFLFLGLALLLSFPLPVINIFIGNPDIGVIIGNYIGALLLGGAFLAIGLLVSSLTKNQIVAFIIAVLISFAFLIIGDSVVLYTIPKFLVPLFSYLSLGVHFGSLSRGVIDSRDIIFYLTFIGIFLYLNTKALEQRKWK